MRASLADPHREPKGPRTVIPDMSAKKLNVRLGSGHLSSLTLFHPVNLIRIHPEVGHGLLDSTTRQLGRPGERPVDLWTTSLLPTGPTGPSCGYMDIIPDDHIPTAQQSYKLPKHITAPSHLFHRWNNQPKFCRYFANHCWKQQHSR